MNDIIIVAEQPQQTFWKKHGKKIKCGLAIASGMVVGILVYKNKDAIVSLVGQFFGRLAKETVVSPVVMQQSEVVETITTRHVDVPIYPRNLPIGQKASAIKLEQAAEWGYELAENQTWVREYSYERVV